MAAPIEKNLLDAVSAIATLITPIILVVLGGIGWLIQNRMQSAQAKQSSQAARIAELEDRLREDRITTYNALLEPFFLLFTSEAAFALDPKFKNKKKDEIAIARMLSVEYRQVGFKLSLVANDSVVRAYNRLMQFFYHIEEDPRPIEVKTSHWIALMSTLLLEIRKSTGNESSALNRWEMIEWFMTDAPKLKALHAKPLGEITVPSSAS
jgi:hypothetical protein